MNLNVHHNLVLTLVLSLLRPALTIKWLALHRLKEQPWMDAADCPSNKTERRTFGMVTHQARMCRRMPELMPIITSAAAHTVQTCQTVFGDRRWNCSTVTLAPDLKADLTRGTKEQAFVYALSAAAVTHQVAKACVTGQIPYCPCGYAETTMTSTAPSASESYKWKGCSDNVVYGKRVSREWADAMWRRGDEAARRRKDVLEFDEEHLNDEPAVQPKNGPKARMNQHNNDVGRIVTQQSLFRKCKCHGVSSGCDIQTCWYTLPPLDMIAKQLKDRYNMAHQIGADPTGSKNDARSTRLVLEPELVFHRASPTYCEEELEMGSLGTRGRECNTTEGGTTGTCENLCCGRGFNTKQITMEEQCHCKYVHCCYIKCKTCTSVLDKHYCK